VSPIDIAVLAAWIVGACVLSRPRRPGPSSALVEVMLALTCGVGFALLSDGWLWQWHTEMGPWLVTDLNEYCPTVDQLFTGTGISHQRSRVSGLVAGLLRDRLGVLEAMHQAGVVHAGVVGVALYTWGRVLSGRMGGLAAVVAGLAMSSLVVMSHDLRFYPAMSAAFALGAAGTTLALRYSRWWALLAAGVGTALTLLADLRGLTFALPFLGLSLVAALACPWRRWIPNLLAWGLPLEASWWIGRWAYEYTTSPLEGQVNVVRRLQDAGIRTHLHRSHFIDSSYIYSYSEVFDIPYTLLNLSQQARALPANFVGVARRPMAWAYHVEPWVPLVGIGFLFLVLAGLRGGGWSRWRRLACLAVFVPFAASLRGTVMLGSVNQHYLGLVAPAAAVLVAAAVSGLGGWIPSVGRGPRGTRPFVVAGVLGLLVLGVAPSALAPDADWRHPWSGQAEKLGVYVTDAATRSTRIPGAHACVNALFTDLKAGVDLSAFEWDPPARKPGPGDNGGGPEERAR